MTLQVRRLGELADDVMILDHSAGTAVGDFAAVVTNIEQRPGANMRAFQLKLEIGAGETAADITVDLAGFIRDEEYQESRQQPLLLRRDMDDPASPCFCILFRDQIFVPERSPRHAGEHEEMILRVKRLAYAAEAEMQALRSYVANMEAADAYRAGQPKRGAIANDVKAVVWARDGGACAACGSQEGLQYDHVIPWSKGGGDHAANIQLLCQPCNLRKSDKIASW